MIQTEIRKVMTEGQMQQDKTLGEGYPFRISTFAIRLRLNSKYSCKELRAALTLMPDIEVDDYHSRCGQTCWRFVK